MRQRLIIEKIPYKVNATKPAIVQICRIGTIMDCEAVHECKYLLSIRNDMFNNIALCFRELYINGITIGLMADDTNYIQFKTLIYQIRSVEIIFEYEDVDKRLISILKDTLVNHTLSTINKTEEWSEIIMKAELNKY